MFLAFVKMNARLEKRKEILQTIQSIVAQMRKENGCVDSNFYQNIYDPSSWYKIMLIKYGAKLSKTELKRQFKWHRPSLEKLTYPV